MKKAVHIDPALAELLDRHQMAAALACFALGKARASKRRDHRAKYLRDARDYGRGARGYLRKFNEK